MYECIFSCSLIHPLLRVKLYENAITEQIRSKGSLLQPFFASPALKGRFLSSNLTLQLDFLLNLPFWLSVLLTSAFSCTDYSCYAWAWCLHCSDDPLTTAHTKKFFSSITVNHYRLWLASLKKNYITTYCFNTLTGSSSPN